MVTISSFLPLIINSGDLSLLIFSKLLNLSLIKNFVRKIYIVVVQYLQQYEVYQ